MNQMLKKIILYLEEKRRFFHVYRYEVKVLEKKKNLYTKVKLNQKQKKQIDDFYIKNYGKKFSHKWHRLYQSYLNVFDEKYFPQILFSTKLEDQLNCRKISKVLEDKSLIGILYNDIKNLYIPKTYLLNCSGIFYNYERDIINKKEAFESLKNIGKVIIKPTIGSNSGRNVLMLNIVDGIDKNTDTSLIDILDRYNENYIIQECLKNSKELSKLNSSSLNTFRIVTYTIEGKMYHCPIALRIGTSGKNVDNLHSGGICVGVSDEGYLGKYALREKGDVFEHHPDTGVVFENYKIPLVEEIIKIAYECHKRTPHQGIASWDFTINDENKICLIEANLMGGGTWFLQCCNGRSLFGENTSYMLNKIAKK